MQLQPYDLGLMFWSGKEMTLHDALSRYNLHPGPKITLDIAIHHTCFTTQWKTAFQNAIAAGPKLLALSQMIIGGWPQDAYDVTKILMKYFSHASTLTVEDGYILWSEALLIPKSEWAQVLQQLHDRQWGITKMNLWAKNVIYWSGMTKDIEQMIYSCNICQHFQLRQCDLLIEKPPTTNCPWQIMAWDLFDFDGGQYMVMANMYSKMCCVQKIPSAGTTSAAIISKMKEIFAEHGVPDILRSEIGPQYASAEFIEFAEERGFQHTTAHPHYPASNGFAESMVKNIKTTFTKAKYSGKDSQLALLALCSTP